MADESSVFASAAVEIFSAAFHQIPIILVRLSIFVTNSCQPALLIRSYAVIRCLRFEEPVMSEAEARPTNFIRQIIDERSG